MCHISIQIWLKYELITEIINFVSVDKYDHMISTGKFSFQIPERRIYIIKITHVCQLIFFCELLHKDFLILQ